MDITPNTNNKELDFKRDLAKLLNRYSMENGSNTPDFLLADYLFWCLLSYNSIAQKNDQWHSKDKQPGV